MVLFPPPCPLTQGKKGLEDSTQIGNLSTRILSTDDARRDRLNFLTSAPAFDPRPVGLYDDATLDPSILYKE